MTVVIGLPLSDEAARAVIDVADRFGVEPWEMGVYLLNEANKFRRGGDMRRKINRRR